MTCESVERELVGYHFNVLPEDARARVEEHLVACPSCVRALVAIKRSIETSADVPSPAEHVRGRLRAAVSRELGVSGWTWWERPFAIALAACVVLASGAATRALMSVPGAPPYSVSHR
jgi:anti-sigma factor RsiW